jgi:hypothetical protein
MKLVAVVSFFSICAAIYAITVEEAWENYKANPKKPDNPDWVQPIPNFETFKRQWDEAKAHNSKYATTQDAWKDYKVRFHLRFFVSDSTTFINTRRDSSFSRKPYV